MGPLEVDIQMGGCQDRTWAVHKLSESSSLAESVLPQAWTFAVLTPAWVSGTFGSRPPSGGASCFLHPRGILPIAGMAGREKVVALSITLSPK